MQPGAITGGGVTPVAYAKRVVHSGLVRADAETLFSYLDDHRRLSGHMTESSWKMGGGRMTIELDEGQGRLIGSHIRLGGRLFGLGLYVEARVISRDPPVRKVWETVGEPRLLVIGRYRMGFESIATPGGRQLQVFIEYDDPLSGVPRVLGKLLGAAYARWCVRQMVEDAITQFARLRQATTA
ncbi:MAG: hypothetical protein WC809_00380 [Sinimarinibacterium sp.]|jgi:hypothetical protein